MNLSSNRYTIRAFTKYSKTGFLNILVALLGVFFLFQTTHAQDETDNFRSYLSSQLDLYELKENPVINYKKSDSIIQALSTDPDSLFNAQFYHLLGQLNIENGNYAVALEYFITAKDYLFSKSNHRLFITLEQDIGNIYYKSNDIIAAEKQYLKATQLAVKNNYHKLEAVALNNRAILKMDRRQFDEANTLFQKAYSIRLETKDHYLIAQSLYYLGLLYTHIDSSQKALKFYEQSVQQMMHIKQKSEKCIGLKARVYNHIGINCIKAGKYKPAHRAIEKSLQTSKNLKSSYERAVLQYQSARGMFDMRQYTLTIRLCLELIEIAHLESIHEIHHQVYGLLAEVYEKQKRYEKAMAYAKKSQQLKAKLKASRIHQKIANEQFGEAVVSKKELLSFAQRERDIKAKELQVQRRITELLILIIIVGLITLASLAYSNREKLKANKKLVETNLLIEQQNDEIKQQQVELEKTKEQLELRLKDLEDLTEEKSHLIGIVAHDLRTPLNSILGLNELLEIELNTPSEDAINYIGLIRESTQRMLMLINNLLDTQRLEQKKFSLDKKTIRIKESIQNILTEYSSWASRKRIKLHLNIAEDLTLETDNYLLQQIMANLISNAIKFSSPEEEVLIEAKEQGQKVILSVKDNGPGISEEDQTKLFEQFQTLSARPTDGEQSLGLGLSGVKKFVELLSGTIHLESSSGNGSTFYVELNKSTPT